jgi:hypothetical protein
VITAVFLCLPFPFASGAASGRATAAPPATSKPQPSKPNATVQAPAPKAEKSLDTATVRRLYLDGDFDEAIAMLESALKAKSTHSHSDSVFVFKHLGVMYAAKYDTRERGKHYMFQLLATEPTAKIMDMYASDMIYMIFKNIQDEFESTRTRMERAQDHVRGNLQSTPPDSAKGRRESGPKVAKSGGNSGWYWLGAAGVAAAAGATAYFMLAEQPAKVVYTDHVVDQ